MTHCHMHIPSRTGPQFCNLALLILQLQAQELMMDLPPENVLTTDNHWASRSMMLLMSFHSKAFQQSPSAELILSPYPFCKGGLPQITTKLAFTPSLVLFLGIWLVLLGMTLACLLSVIKDKNSSTEHEMTV